MEKMYGLTHDQDGKPIVRVPRALKVGIGLPQGKAIDVVIDQNGKWCVRIGVGREAKVTRFETMEEARKFYKVEKPKAPDRKYPQRLSYFSFTHVSPDGTFEPAWEVIAEHGPAPSETDVAFLSDNPLTARYEMWTAAELKCYGDGIDASRVISMAETDEEKELAREAQAKGERYFPIVHGCWTMGCPYTQPPDERHPAPCRPRGRLIFQLVRAPRLGTTAYFDTTGRRSISNLFSGIIEFKTVTGNGDPGRGFIAGVPLKLVVRPYRTSHNGMPAIQYGVSLEFRAESALEAKRLLIEHAVKFRDIIAEPRRMEQLEAATAPTDPVANPADVGKVVEVDSETGQPMGEGGTVPPASADAMAAEFYPDPEADRPDDDDFAGQPADTVEMPRRKSEAKKDEPKTETREAADPESRPRGGLFE